MSKTAIRAKRPLRVRRRIWYRQMGKPRMEMLTASEGWQVVTSYERARTYATAHGYAGIHVEPAQDTQRKEKTDA